MSEQLVELTTEIVASYVSNNAVSATDLPALIKTVYGALATVETDEQVVEQTPLVPAVSVKKSVTPDWIISLEDGRKFKSMKRHLALKGMTPDDYRKKWNLPSDYPMTAPNYALARSALAKAIGLGAGGRQVKGGGKAAPAKTPAPRGRPRKTPQ